MTKRVLAQVLLAPALFITIAACSDDRTNGGSIRRPKTDADVVDPVDTGIHADASINPNDTGVIGCGANPSGCVPGELTGTAPVCACLGICTNGMTVHPVNGCGPQDAAVGDGGTPPDTGLPPNDGGVPGDSGTPGACRTNANCATGEACVESDTAPASNTFEPCNNTCVTGACARLCDPFAVASGCQNANPCTFLGTMSLHPDPKGLCIGPGMGGSQGQACVATFDAAGAYTGDNCNRFSNHVCNDAWEMDTSGVCARFCRPGVDVVCGALGNYQCSGDPGGIGLCLNPPPAVTDVGRLCPPAGAVCQRACTVTNPFGIGMFCTVGCTGLDSCPTGAICVGQPPDLAPICAFECVPGVPGNTACAARATGATCLSITTDMSVGICDPP